MGKAPSFQFYPGDWFREPGLKCVDLDVRGAWAELLMIMWDSNPQGQMQTSLLGFAKLWRTTPQHAAYIIDELAINHIATVEYFDEKSKEIILDIADYFRDMSRKCPNLSQKSPAYVTLTNRRMFKSWKDRQYERERKAKQRAKNNNPSKVPQKSHSLSSSSSSKKEIYKESAKRILLYLNHIGAKHFTPIKSNLEMIQARLKEGHTEEECKKVIDIKWADPDFKEKYFRPSTLFRPSKFEGYLNEPEKADWQ